MEAVRISGQLVIAPHGLADRYDDRSRPNRAGFVLSQMVR